MLGVLLGVATAVAIMGGVGLVYRAGFRAGYAHGIEAARTVASEVIGGKAARP